MAWGSTRLREQSVRFVSAGTLVQEDIAAVAKETDERKEQEDSSRVQTAQQQETVVEDDQVAIEDNLDNQGEGNQGDQTVDQPPPVEVVEQKLGPRKNSASSHSSEEILFSGRQNLALKSARRVNSKPKRVPSPAAAPPSNTIAPLESGIATPEATAHDSSSSELHTFKNILLPHRSRALDRRGRPRVRSDMLRRREEEEAIMSDYIANLAFDDDSGDNHNEDQSAETGRGNDHFRFFDGAGEQDVKVQTKPLGNLVRQFTPLDQAIDWDSGDLEDFDDLSTTDEEVAEVSQVLRYRSRPSGPQYLVTAIGQDTSDARWVLHENLKSTSAIEEIRIFEKVRTMKIQVMSDDQDSEPESDEFLDDLVGDIKSEGDENERILNYTSRMTDEQIAQALAKQEELGMGSDELLLFDGQVDDDDEVVDEFAAGGGFIPFSSKKHLSSRTTSRRNRRQRESFPPAEAFADALEQDPYGAFDVMDFDRPSLRPKKKGRKSDFPSDLGLEDEELAERLRNTWSKDREKKTARKREKQEQLAATLLEASERNHPAAIKAEIRQFLCQEVETLKLAPMDSATRASVHRLAKALKLQSRSEGKEGHGIGRYPVLTKSPHTPRYTIDTVWEVDALLNMRKFFPKHGPGLSNGLNARNQGPTRARRGGGGAISGATYMNGDIVGASAPELGSDNKGRAMLEKMGWTSGMGIGAVGNKGGLEAIKHVVKTTRAGLG